MKRLQKAIFLCIRTGSLLFAVSAISFALISASPIDPVQQYILGLGSAISPEQRAEIEAYWGVNQPPVERYVHWLGQLLQGNWGESALYRRPVLDIIGERFVNSLALMLCAWVLSGVIGFVLGRLFCLGVFFFCCPLLLVFSGAVLHCHFFVLQFFFFWLHMFLLVMILVR